LAVVELRHAGPLAYRRAKPEGEASGPAVALVHGYPESSLMWEPLMERLAAAGRRSVAPDLYNLGDSQETGPATFQRNLDALTEFMDGLEEDEVVLIVHDWGGHVGLAWACDHPEQIAAMVISDTGFFSNGRWHGLADTLRGPDGEKLVQALDRQGFAGMMNGAGNAFSDEELDAYWKPFEDGRGQRATLDYYRSLDFSDLSPWDGMLAAIGAPTLILWGAEDPFAILRAGERFHRELPNSELVAVEGAGHFVWDEEPERCADEVLRFLGN
jgi:pimeloyl-ACP methyl ester carboxylesterase